MLLNNRRNEKKNGFRLPIYLFVIFCLCNVLVFAQESRQFSLADLLPKMGAQDPTNAEQVRAMEQAQVALMDYCLQTASAPGNEKERAAINAEMIKALTGDTSLDAKVWMLHLLGWMGTDSEVGAIADFIGNKEVRLEDEAIRALASIRTDKSRAVLLQAQGRAKDATLGRINAALKCWNIDLAVPAEREMPMAIPYNNSIILEKMMDRDLDFVLDPEKDENYPAFKKWMEKYESMSDDDKARTINSLAVKKAVKYRSLVLKELDAKNIDLRKSAILALEKLGNVNDIISLKRLFTDDSVKGTVILVMKRVEDDKMDSFLVDELKKSVDDNTFVIFADICTQRNIKKSLPIILDRVVKKECPWRVDLLAAAQTISGEEEIPVFVDALLYITDPRERDRVEHLIAALCNRNATKVIEKMDANNSATLLPLLGRIGGNEALKKVKALLSQKENQELALLAIRALCNWPDATVADDLMSLACNKDVPEGIRIQTLRGFVRVITLPPEQRCIDIDVQGQLKLLKKAMEVAIRKEERQLVLSRASAVRDPEIAAWALEYIDDAELRETACQTIVDLAHHDFLRKMNPSLFKKALDVVLQKTENKELLNRAERYRGALK